MKVRPKVENPGDFKRSAEQVLYVEGQPAAEGLDVQVLRRLLPSDWVVRAAGNSADLLGAARALAYPHPKWVFVVDRDHHDDQRVARSWDEFNPSAGRNLLIWCRKELENLFLEPEWLARSRYLRAGTTVDALREEIRLEMGRRLWGDVVDRVVAQVRHRVKQAPAHSPETRRERLQTRAQAEEAVLVSAKLAQLRSTAGSELSEDALRSAFQREADLITGGETELVWGTGQWRELLPGKGVLGGLVNRCFRVPDDSRPTILQGSLALIAVANDLFDNHRDHMPQDFKDLLDKLETVK